MPPITLRPARLTVAFSRRAARSFSNSARMASNQPRDDGQAYDNEGSSDIAGLLERPAWSVSSHLVEDKNKTQQQGKVTDITLDQLRHLLRLSALPFPTSAEDQAAKISTLRTQLLFVRDIQSVDTNKLLPLHAIRDETQEGLKQYTIGVKEVEQTLLQEEPFGYNRRPRRRKRKADTAGAEDWDSLATAPRKAGRYIVVDGVEQ